MADSDLPSDVQLFLHDQIDSLEQLESLLLLFRRPEQIWSATDVARELQIGDSVAEEALRALCERGLLFIASEPGQFHYRPSSPAVVAQIERLADAHAVQRAALMRLLTAKAIQRVRAGALGLFSGALVTGMGEKPEEE
jgi:hypothetical protein